MVTVRNILVSLVNFLARGSLIILIMSLQSYADTGKVVNSEAIGIRVSFSTLCKYGVKPVVDNIADYNFNIVLPTVKSREDIPLLKELIKECHKKGIEVHPTISTFTTSGKPLSLTKEYLALGPDGESHGRWYCPSKKKVIEWKINFAKHIVEECNIDGFELDYIRFCGDKTCYCNECRRRFEREMNIEVGNFPKDVLEGGAFEREWNTWRKTVTTGFVEKTKKELKRIKPEIIFSVSTWNVGQNPIPTKVTSMGEGFGVEAGQDYSALSKISDFIRPMLYHKKFGVDTKWIRKMTEKAVKNSQKAHVYVGITVGYKVTPEELRDAICSVRDAGGNGIIIHPYSCLFKDDKFLPVLKEMFPQKVVLPHQKDKYKIIRGVIAGFDASLMKDLKMYHANGLFFFSPSQNSEKRRRLCLEEGIATFAEESPRREPFTYKDKKNLWQLRQPLCVNGNFKKLWTDRLINTSRKFAPDSLGLCPDEFYWANAQLRYTCGVKPGKGVPFYCNCSDCQMKFKKAYGHELPQTGRSRILHGNTCLNRDFILFRYESVAGAFREWMKAVKKANPLQKTSLVLSAVSTYALERYPSGICWDIIGQKVPVDDVIVTAFPSSYDYRGPETHYWITETTKRLMGAFKRSRVGIVINLYDLNIEDSPTSVKRKLDGKYIPVKVRPVDIYGNLLSSIANGAETFFCFHKRHIKGYKRDAVIKGFSLVEAIEPWLQGTQLPKNIALLYSRSGEDFYSLSNSCQKLSAEEDGSEGIWKHGGHAQPANRYAYNYNIDKNEAGSLGFRVQKDIMHSLLKEGYPFDLHFLDQLKFQDVKDYPILVLPFPYSISQKTLNILRKSLMRGAKILIVSKLGDVNENGERYQKAQLLDMMRLEKYPCRKRTRALGNGKIVYLPEGKRNQTINEIKKLLKDNRSLFVKKTKRHDTEVILRKKDNNGKVIFIINWEDKNSQVKIGINVGRGNYKITYRSIKEPSKLKTFGNKVFTSRELKKLKIELEPQEAKVFFINKIEK